MLINDIFMSLLRPVVELENPLPATWVHAA